MRERVGTILHHDEGNNYPDRPYHMERGRHWGGPMHPGPQLTDEQVKEREARRAEWEKMTPEERQKAHEEKYSKWREERMKNMTPEEKERFEQREKQREEWRKMTPEERQKAREEARAKWDSMSDAEKTLPASISAAITMQAAAITMKATANTATIKVNTAASTEAAIMATAAPNALIPTAPGKYQKLT